jgi:hypothetical protein
MRLKLTAELRSRDGTLAKGAKMKNTLAEVRGGIVRLVKRPGASLLLEDVVADGQGAVGLAGALYIISGDTLRKIIVSPPSASTTWAL